VSSESSDDLLDSLFDVVHTKQLGDLAEVTVMGAFLRLGFQVAIPWGENTRYDLIVDTGDRLLRVQCKTASLCGWNGDRSCLRFHGYSHRFEAGKFQGREDYRGAADIFAAYSPDTGQVYVLAVDEVPKTDVWLRMTPAKNGQQNGIRMASEHTVERWSKRQAGTASGARL
jgi:hypothetical protein